ncbi:MAG: copper-binding protein [Rhodocyclales bacterium]|jgi:Cu/Ag efflux protein CusF|nr:copper-binding protein [Rhodocyclales bacterium]
MKVIAAIAFVLTAGFSMSGIAASDHGGHAGHAAMSEKPNTDVALTEGLVKKVDKSAGKVTVSHGPLPNGMPAMTMVFKVKDMMWLDQMKDGGKIRFAADQINGVMTIIRFALAE